MANDVTTVTPAVSQATALLSPPFLVAAGMLALAGGTTFFSDLKQTKEALPLKSPLAGLAEAELAPYRVVERRVLEPVIIDALGTDQYLSWVLEDTRRPQGDPLHLATLMVTYYSGGHVLVPHTPDVCFLGSGYAPAQPHENRSLTLATLPPSGNPVPIRVCTFEKTALFEGKKTTVIYTFHCNGRYVASRMGVRLLTHDPRATYAYFSKVEVSFPGATREQNIEGTQALLERVLPVLMRDHWPDWNAAEQKACQAR
ncbi:MAG: exosortase-associated EpsI family protein [Phycisphaerae bacterium]